MSNRRLVDSLRGGAHILRLLEARFNIDPYKILGLSRNASPEEVKKAYRRLAHANHPDQGGDRNKMAEINQAHDILSDSKKRQEYDAASGGTPDAPVGPEGSYLVHILFGGKPKVNMVASKKEAIDMVAAYTTSKIEVTKVVDPQGKIIYKGNKHKI